MKPGHGPDFQRGNGPYSLVVVSNFKNGYVTVDIKSSNGKTFEGFLVQARDGKSDKAYSAFVNNPEYRYMSCSGIKASSVSHKDNKPKSSVSLKWAIAGDMVKGSKVIFKATVVEEFEKFYHLTETVTL